MAQLRMRVFAGPNGSGKSTVIQSVRNMVVEGRNIGFGFYINADDIASALSTEGSYAFSHCGLSVNTDDFQNTVLQSGLVANDAARQLFSESFSIAQNKIYLKLQDFREQLAQIIADFLRKKLLQQRKRFSFETVFSHTSKLDIIKEAVEAGYKVYLYFVSTEDVEINKFRVQTRVEKGGHDVPVKKIEDRYERSLSLMYPAAQYAYQAYFFDNSKEDVVPNHFAHFKMIDNKKEWDIDELHVPSWFIRYYSSKIK